MNKEKILEILNDWNFWNQKIETGIQREFYLQKIDSFLDSEQIITITGARRSGKSYLMRQTIQKLMQEKKVSSKNILMVNLEDPRFENLSTDLLQNIYETYLQFLKPDEQPYIFLDEIQEVKNWEKWVLMMQELKKAHLIISGSNAKLLSQELSTLLTGRHLDVEVFPLDFSEFLKFKNLEIKTKLDLINKRIEIQQNFDQYLEFGSLPKVVLEDNKNELLVAYYKDVVEKDLIKRYQIRKDHKFRALLKFYFSNISTLTTFSSQGKSLEISTDTVEKYASYLESAFVLFFLPRFSFKVKEQEKSPRKVYSLDVGLANFIGFGFSKNKGRLLENLVFLKLKKDSLEKVNQKIFYWKDERHREIDFVVQENKKVKEIIQVSWDLENEKTREREIKSFLKVSKELKCDNLLIITRDTEDKIKIADKKIKIVPIWKWLLMK